MLCVFQVDTQFILHDYFHIVAIGIFDLCKQFVFVAVADRSQVRNAGSNVEYVHLFGGIKIDVFADFRPGTHQAHIADEYVDELRQLVEFVFTDVISRTSHAWIASSDGDKSFLVGTYAHRAEFE